MDTGAGDLQPLRARPVVSLSSSVNVEFPNFFGTRPVVLYDFKFQGQHI